VSPLKALILGLVQGLTEFLPISSSGHLVIFNYLLGVESESIAFEVAVHLGTLLAVIIYFREDLLQVIVDFFRGGDGRRVGWMLIAASVPTGIIGLTFQKPLEALFNSPRSVGIGLLITAVVLLFAEKYRQGNRSLGKVRLQDALLIGTLQGMAIIPGISRSGSTISAGLFAGLGRDAAARFSFLLAIPAILAAGALHAKDFVALPQEMLLPSLIGVATSAISGYLAIGILMAVLRKGKLYGFSAYTAVVGLLILIFLPA